MLSNEISAIIAQLVSPLTAEEAASGWSEKSKSGVLPFFENLLIDVQAGHPIPYIGIVRGLDAWGVEGGSLYEQIMHVSAALNEKNK